MSSIPKPIHRQNHTGILIELEALIDLDIGVIFFLRSQYEKDPEANSILDKDILGLSLAELRLLKWKDPDFKYRVLPSLSHDAVDGIYNDIMTANMEDVLNMAPLVQSIGTLVDMSHKVSRDILYTEILVRNHEYLPILKKRFPKVTFLEEPENEKIDFKPYARFILEDINRILKYTYIELTNITILSYPKNITTVKGKTMLLPDPIIACGVYNEFSVIDPITGVNNNESNI